MIDLCSHSWRSVDRGQGHEHHCAQLIQDASHACRCCCGAIDYQQWDLPRRKTPHLSR